MHIAATLRDDLRRGWAAPAGVVLTGAGLAVLVSVPFAFVASWLGLEGGMLVFATGAVQLLVNFVLAGRIARRDGGRG